MPKANFNPELYRPNVGIMMVNACNEVFVAQRIDSSKPAWQMPQGGVDEGESPYQAARRELHEEIGVTNVKFISQINEWLYYDLPASLQGKLWHGRYRGQRQKWFLVRFLGQEDEINLQSSHPEFSAWRWVAFEKLPDLAVPFKKAVYETICAQFHYDLFGDNK